MKLTNSLRLVLATGLALGALPVAFAAGTTAGTSIANTASVDFEVGGVNQTDVDSNTTTFVVDRKINLTVAEVGGAATSVVPGSTGRVTIFTVTNDANSTLDFRLSGSQDASTTTTAFGDTDNFNVTGLAVFVETNGTPGYQSAGDTATYIDELTPGSSRTVYVIGSIPSGAVNGDVAGVTLTAIAAESTNALTGAHVATVGTLAADAAETNTADVDDVTFIDTVFGDVAGDTDAVTDGRHSDDDQYDVVTAAISVTKSATVVTDPFNCTIDGDNSSCTNPPKAIPGAIVEYCLDVENTGTATADSIVLTDNIPLNTTYLASSITSAATGTGADCDLGSGTAETDAAGGNGELSALPAPRGSVIVRSAAIAAAARFKATFRVTVD